MIVGIVCAVEAELKPFLNHMALVETVDHAMLRIHSGFLDGVQIVALFCGVAKVNAAIATQILIDQSHVDCIILSGTAGGIDRRLKIGDTVISTEVTYHDLEEGVLVKHHPWMPDLSFRAGDALLAQGKRAVETGTFRQRVFFGTMVTGDYFADAATMARIRAKYDPMCIDMETAAVAHACYVNGVPFLAIRSVTDTEDHSGKDAFDENCALASENSFAVARAILTKLK